MIKLPKTHSRDDIRTWLLAHSNMSDLELVRHSGISSELLLRWRIEYDVINLRNKKLFVLWVYYKDYTVAEASIVLGVTQRAILHYLDKYGINKHRELNQQSSHKHKESNRQFSNYYTPKTIYEPLDRAILKDKKMLRKLYESYGKAAIAKMCHVSITRVAVVLKRFGIIDSNRGNTTHRHRYKNR